MYNVYLINEASKTKVATVASVADAIASVIGNVMFSERDGDAFDFINDNNEQYAVEPVEG